jgi:hypothetical protein
LRWSMQTKWYGKSRNGVSFDRLACNRQKETDDSAVSVPSVAV